MPSLAAAVIASIAGWILDSIISPWMGLAGRIFLGIAVSTYVYVYARNWLRDMRG